MTTATHLVHLLGVTYPVFVDTTTANYDGDCLAQIASDQAINGWLSLADGEAVASKATYLDGNRSLRMLRRLSNGTEYTATIELMAANGQRLEWSDSMNSWQPIV